MEWSEHGILPECYNDGMMEYLEDGDEAAAHG